MSGCANDRIHRLGDDRASLSEAVKTLTDAFHDDVMWTAIFPDRTERRRVMPRLWAAVIGYCRRYGCIYASPGTQGVACWTRPGMERPTPWRVLRTGFGFSRPLLAMSSQSRRQFLQSMKEIDRIHHDVISSPHWYLWALGVRPEAQRRGIGGRLLQPILDCSRHEDIPCYLETETEENAAFYQRRGFDVVRTTEIGEPGFTLWFMTRSGSSSCVNIVTNGQ